MKKLLFVLVSVIFCLVTLQAKQTHCSGNDGVSYVTVTTAVAASPGTNFIVKGYGKYTNATAFITFNEIGSRVTQTLTVDIRKGEGKAYTTTYDHKIENLKVTVADFCK